MLKPKPKPKYVDPVIAWMEKHDIPITRDNYIRIVYGNEPVEWDIENELDLPLEVQDLDLFEYIDGEYEYLGMKQKKPEDVTR